MAMLFVGVSAVHATESTGTFDASFGDNGIKDFTLFGNDNSSPVAGGMVAVTGNKVLTLVNTTNASYQNTGVAVVATTATGTVDTSFNSTGFIRIQPSGTVSAVTGSQLILAGSNVYLLGNYTDNTNGSGFYVAKFSTSGVLDNTWGTGGVSYIAPALQLMNILRMTIGGTTGKIYVLGGGNYDWILRLGTNGSVDTTFGRTGANGAGYYMGIFMGSPYGSYVTRDLAGLTVDETTTPYSYNVISHPSATQIVIQHLKLGTTQTSMSGINLYQADADTSWAATSYYSGSSQATNGFIRVDVSGMSAIKSYAVSAANIMYVLGNPASGAGYTVTAIDLSQKRPLSGFGTNGTVDLTSFGFNTSGGASGIDIETLGGDTQFVYGYDSANKGMVVKLNNGVADNTFGTNGVVSFLPCVTFAPVSMARTGDGALNFAAQIYGTPVKLRYSRLTNGGSSSSCGTTTTTTTMPVNNTSPNNGPNNGPNNTIPNSPPSLPTPTYTVSEIAGPGIRVTLTSPLVSGARFGAMVYDSANLPSNFAAMPWYTEAAVGATTVDIVGSYPTINTQVMPNVVNQARVNLVAGIRYRIMVMTYTGTIMNQTAAGMGQSSTLLLTGTVASTTTVATPVSSNAIPGVTVTDTKVYTAAPPAKVADGSAITVMTPAQNKTADIISKTPAVCLPADDNIVFIGTGQCVAQVVNALTGAVLRSLKTKVVADEVSSVGVGNQVAVLAPIYFAGGSSDLDAAAKARLKTIKDQVTAAGTVLLVGHSGILMGDTPENKALSKARAVSVANGLKAVGAQGPFYVTPVAADDPATRVMTRAAQAKNRRVIIVLVP